MNLKIVRKICGYLLSLEAIMMIPPLLISIMDNSYDKNSFIITILITFFLGLYLQNIEYENKNIKITEGLLIVSIGWLSFSIFGALPFLLSGTVPTFADAFFETVSGFTTTGATILSDIEIIPRGLLFWRSFTHWIGGMGILVFTVALLPNIGVSSFRVFRAESPGPISTKIMPKIKDSASTLYLIYVLISIFEVILLMFGGMSFYESLIHMFGTLGTGGFSSRNASIGAFNSNYIHVIISIFMILSATNFNLYFLLYKRKFKDVFKNEEFLFFIKIVSISTILIGLNLYFTGYGSLIKSFIDSLFQTSSIISTTGYATADFDIWPTFCKSILFLLMFLGGCAGSTGGGIKIIRILILLKLIRREVTKIFHPRAIVPIKINKKTISRDIVTSITGFLIIYLLLVSVGTIIVSLENISFESSISAVVACISNVGPGFDAVGPTTNYGNFSIFTKYFLSIYMILGRLEFYTFIALLAPKSWKDSAE